MAKDDEPDIPPDATPMMAQFLGIKSRYPDALLFYRMGDFYELFFDDAVAAAAALDIALTKRGKHAGADIPMCGVPAHSHETYLLALISKGFRVAVCEQLEDPAEAKKRGAKSVVRRDVVRLVTPGTLTEDALLDARAANALAAWVEIRGEGALARLDLSTGDVVVASVAPGERAAALAGASPREVLVSHAAAEDEALRDAIEEAGAALTPLGAASFDSAAAETRLKALYGVGSLDGFAAFTRPEIAALGALADYVEITQRGAAARLKPPRRETPGAAMRIDAATRRNLELTRALSGGAEGSLLSAIDRTCTAPGARLLGARLAQPATDPREIIRRQDALAAFLDDPALREATRAALRRAPDMERALSRLGLGRGGPRDLASLRSGLAEGVEISALIGRDAPELIATAVGRLSGHEAFTRRLAETLVEEPPLSARDGGFIASGADADLDEARRYRDEGRSLIAGLQTEYAAETGVASLKIKHNNVLGYFIEVGAAHGPLLTDPAREGRFRHRQTMALAMRFSTAELADFETRILNAGARALEIELALFAELCDAALACDAAIFEAAAAIAEIDVAAALAELAAREDWARPVVDDSFAFEIAGGRHPVVEAALRRAGDRGFAPNDCDLSGGEAGRLWLLTGPNMAGKSTFLRQNALIAVLAQIGAWVPAAAAHIGVVDQLFSRVGAADDLARGRSTFMVEMVETAAILNQAGPRALVILDEIGRGTATYDGLSIAWATLEHLHEANRCRALFATHYHELTALAERLADLRCATVAVREWEGEVIFLHEVRPGAADRSYGVQVARLAGLPDAVIARARDVLERLEDGERTGGGAARGLAEDLPLFSASRPARPPAHPARAASAVEERLAEMNPDDMTPLEAMEAIYALKAALRDDGEAEGS